MKNEAVALCRVSTAEQRVDGNSLDSQQRHVYEFAHNHLGCEIEKAWVLDVSSKAGKNVKRKDLYEIRDYCRKNKHIKYFIVDKVNRLMREVEYFYWFKTELKFMGVKLLFAEPTQQELNGDSDIAVWKTFLEIFSAEKDNKERSQTTTTRMKDRVLLGYYPFFPKQGYRKSGTPGLHEPDGERFILLKDALQNIAAGKMNRHEAFADLTKKGYTTPNGKPLRIDVFNEILNEPYYAGFIKIERWEERFHEIKGLQVPMITEEEHEAIKAVMRGKRNRVVQQHNPDFPLSNILLCECGGKFVGLWQGNGKGDKYPRYRCRSCGRQLRREEIHQSFESLLEAVEIPSAVKEKLVVALEKAWRLDQQQSLQLINSLKRRKNELNEQKTSLIIQLPKSPELSDDIKQAIEKIKNDVTDIDLRITEAERIEEDLASFISFSLDFIGEKREQIWETSYDDRLRFKQLIFPGEIYADFSKKVCTHQLSPILCLKDMKKEALNASNSILVGLVGFEPTAKRL